MASQSIRFLLLLCFLAVSVLVIPSPFEATEQSPDQNLEQYAQADEQLAQSLVTIYDHLKILIWSSRKLQKDFTQTIPQELYDYQLKLQQTIHYLSEIKTEDPLRNRVLAKTIEVAKLDLSASEHVIKAVVMAKQANAATPACNDTWDRGVARSNLANEIRGSIKGDMATLYRQSPTLQNNMPNDLFYFTGIKPRPSCFRIGTENLISSPFYLLVVYPGSFASELGLKPGDLIISANGKKMQQGNSIEDFKMIIQNNLGKKIDVVVERGGKEQTLTLDIPETIPARHLY
ncbi:MAG: PDZ domain-containing protein [Synergistota bacterium]|nr:PDZ domain-containing protein [Synergistota bacterium]